MTNVNVEAKSVDPDQTALLGAFWATLAVWSVSTQFDQEASKPFQQRIKADNFCSDPLISI